MKLKISGISLLLLLSTVLVVKADFKFGLMNAIKSEATKLDAEIVRLGGPVPDAPTNLTAQSGYLDKIVLSWTKNSTTETGFRIKRGTSQFPAGMSIIGTALAGTTYYVDSSVLPGTTYYYQIAAFNGVGTSQFTSLVSGYTTNLSLNLTSTFSASSAKKVKVVGNYAYVACDTYGIKIVDISNPSSPVQKGSLTFTYSASAYNIDVSGSYLYAACGSYGLKVVNISNVNAPVEVGSLSTGSDSIYDVTYKSGYVYAATSYGLRIINVASPSSPSSSGTYFDYNYQTTLGISVSGNYAYLAESSDGLKIVNISNISSPYLSGSINSFSSSNNQQTFSNGNIVDVSVSGNYAYLADSSYGLRVVNVANPSAPTYVGGCNSSSGSSIYDIVVNGDYAYVSDYNNGVKIIRVTDTSSPTEIGSCGGSLGYGVSVSNGYLYMANNSGINVYENSLSTAAVAATPTTAPIAPTSLSASIASTSQINLTWSDNSDNESGFTIQRGTNTSNYIFISTTTADSTSYSDTGLTLGTSYYYRIRSFNSVGSSSWNTTGPLLLVSSDITVGYYNTDGTAYKVFVSSNYAYIADGTNGLVIVDVSTPSAPTYVNKYTNTSYGYAAYDVYVKGNYAYVAYGDGGLVVLNISNVTTNSAPTVAGTASSYTTAYSVCVKDNYAYLLAGNYLYALDVSDLSNIQYHYNNSSYPYSYGYYSFSYYFSQRAGLSIVGNYAYVAADNSSNGYRIIDISNPAALSSAGSYTGNGAMHGVQVMGDYAYLANDTNGLRIINNTNMVSPSSVKTVATSGTAYGVSVKGNYAYMAVDTAGIDVIDISTPSAASKITNFDTPGNANGVFVKGNYTYVADGASGLRILEFSVTSSTQCAPEAPTNLSITNNLNNTYSLNWTDNSNNEIGFVVQNATYSTSAAFVSSTTLNSYSDTNLQSDTTYYYRVYAYNSYGISNYTTAKIYVPPLPAPTNFVVTQASTTFVKLGWADNSSSETGYVIQRSTVSSYAVFVSSLSANTTSYTDTGLMPNTPYYYRVYAYYSSGYSTYITTNTYTAAVPITRVGFKTTTDSYSDVVVSNSGNYAYAVLGSGAGLVTFDVSSATSPAVVGNKITISNSCNRLTISTGAYLYLADGSTGITAVDVSVSSSPVKKNSVALASDSASDVLVSGSYAYVGGSNSYGLKIFDVSKASAPVLASVYPASGSFYSISDIALYGSNLYIASNYHGINIIDVSNLSNMANADVNSVTSSDYYYSYAVGISTITNHAFIGTYYGIRVIDISNTSSLSPAAYIDTNYNSITKIVVDGKYMYAASNYFIKVYDISVPANPREIASYPEPNGASTIQSFYVKGNYIYVADGSNGLLVLRIDLP